MQNTAYTAIILSILMGFQVQAFAGSDDCFSLMRNFMKASRSNVVPVNSNVGTQLTESVRTTVLRIAKESELTEIEAEVLLERVPTGNIDLDRLRSYVRYISTLREKPRNRGIEEVAQLFIPPTSGKKSKIVVDYEKLQAYLDKKRTKKFKNELKKLKRKNPNESTLDLEKKAKRASHQFRDKYEKLTYGCRSHKSTPEKKAATKQFKKFVMSIGIASSIGGYTYANYDREFDADWFGKLGYGLSISILSNFLGARVLTNSNNTVFMMGLKSYLLSRSFGVVDMGLYSTLFSGSQEEARSRLDQMMSREDISSEMAELSEFLQNERTFAKYKRMIIAHVKSLLKDNTLAPEENYKLDYNNFDFENLKPEDLDDPEIQELVIAAILAQEYDENRGNIIATGDVGADRFSFHAAYGLAMLPKDIATNLYIYRTLCMGQLNPKAALMKAVGLYTINRVVFDQLYYFVRRSSINQ
jgi:hypothetical protein